jgi:hypothetical protein
MFGEAKEDAGRFFACEPATLADTGLGGPERVFIASLIDHESDRNETRSNSVRAPSPDDAS